MSEVIGDLISPTEVRERFPGVELSDMQIKFCYYYSLSANGMKSVRQAGFSHSTPGSQSSAAHKLLHKDKIRELVQWFKSAEGRIFIQERIR